MAGKPSEPARAGRPEDIGGSVAPDAAGGRAPRDASDAFGKPAQADERSGPVAIARHLKSDGRALILYTRDPPA
jgi:hypothetical protein